MNVTPQQVLIGLAVVLVVTWIWRLSLRRARTKAETVHAGVRPFSLAGRTIVGALLISGLQWLALAHPGSTLVVKVLALVVPALVASWVLVRALTVTTVDDRRARGRHRGGDRR